MKIPPSFPQRPEQFRFVNRFSSRFLKNRIRMMNQKTKYGRSWPVYVFLFAVTGLVTTMAAVEKQNRTRQPLITKKEAPAPVATKVAHQAKPASFRAEPATTILPESSEKVAESTEIALDSAKTAAEEKPAGAEKISRYVVQQGNMVYWVITPKMSFNDLIEFKQTIEKLTTFTFDFNKIKYDPFQLYIDALEVKVHKANKSAGSTYDDDENDEPIKSLGGYLTDNGSLGMGGSEGFGMPAVLQELAREDEKATAALLAENRTALFIYRKQRKGPGNTRSVKGDWLRANPGRRNEGLGVFINAENRLQLYHPENVIVMINGRERNPGELATIDPKHLHSVIVTDVRDEAAGPGRAKRYVQLFESQPLEEFK